jgi:hypothetical protein
LAVEGAGREFLLDDLERLPKRDRFWESRSSPLSFLPRPNGMVADGGCDPLGIGVEYILWSRAVCMLICKVHRKG